ncbi:MAG: DUF4838 domain-containing protein, partial [Kiritimatiellae bacterium]|nr:DUF4838 domain-containing protein [Kiritimatiellia bacterium]
VKVQDGKVWFWGDDSWEHQPGWEERQHPGTLFAVYAFLDEVLGVKWPYPGDADTVLPKKKRFKLQDGWRLKYCPPLLMSIVRNRGALQRKPTGQYVRYIAKSADPKAPPELRMTTDDFDLNGRLYGQWLLRNRNYSRVRFEYGHAFNDWQNRFLKKHPDWFGYDPVTRSRRTDTGGRGLVDQRAGSAKLCLSNPEVREQILRDWKEKGAPEWYNICPNDGTPGYCRCDNCMKLDERKEGETFYATLTDRYLWFWNRILDSAVEVRPDVKFVTYIYSYYRQPSRRERIEYPDNLIAGMVPSIADDHETYFSEWQKRGLKRFFLRPNFLSYGMAFYRGHERLIYDCFQIARRYGAIGMDMSGGGGDCRQKDIESYVTARVIAYPEMTFDEICDEFYSQYGAASNAVRTVREQIRVSGEDAVNRLIRNNSDIRAGLKRILDDSMLGKYAVMGNTEKALRQYVGILRTARSELENRLSAVERRRLDNEIIRFEHSLLSFRFREVGQCKTANLNELVGIAKKLHDFRVANKEAIGRQFDGTYGLYGKKGGEAEIWKRAMPSVFK